MAYYDPSGWVKDPTDKLIDDWEKIIILKKRAEERYSDSGYKPKNRLSLAVRVKEALRQKLGLRSLQADKTARLI